MSSIPHTGSDAVITVKVAFDGATCRTKMPLREMAPGTLEQNIRHLLQLPSNSNIMMERYSDSAAAFVMLDASNSSVYKQLYRAAKAKSKLKLRVSLLQAPVKRVPKAVTVEDALDTANDTPVATAEPVHPIPSPASTNSSPRISISKEYDACYIGDAARRWEFDNRLQQVLETNKQLEKEFERMCSQMAECKASHTTPTVPKLSGPLCQVCPASGMAFAVCCNSCEENIPDAHYHCSTCDDGDFDLCRACVERGITCYSDDHWLIKRTVNNGQIVNSTTETIATKPTLQATCPSLDAQPAIPVAPASEGFRPAKPILNDKAMKTPVSRVDTSTAVGDKKAYEDVAFQHALLGVFDATKDDKKRADTAAAGLRLPGDTTRTCNQCVSELPEDEFLHCTTCDDYDLCQPCFVKDAHGHHPSHGFASAVPGTEWPSHVRIRMGPGRNQVHHAICDGCDTYIVGVRHKCLDCPDWDYCVKCVQNAHVSHPIHRFAAIYDPLADLHASAVVQPTHSGICCDGPLCIRNVGTYIRGVRYKCAVCHDLDFCANCEASPANDHNKTHPLIKFKTPVRHVTVSTSGEHQDGTRMPTLGDRLYTCSKATGTASLVSANTINTVQTVVDVKPTESASPPPRPAKQVAEPEPKVEPVAAQTEVKPQVEDLHAVFLRDSVPDGTVLPPNHVFEQTWVLRNEGKTIWPAGCSVKFVGGDYMGHVDSAHPAGISELVSASESTVCYAKLSPGQECSFTALLRTPSRIGKMISYWRLTAPDGTRFGHRLWCEVNVRAATCSAAQVTAPEPEPKPAGAPVSTSTLLGKTEAEPTSQESSTMIFPKVETESPIASVHEKYSQTTSDATDKTDSETYKDEDDEWDLSDDDFLTEEEYDVLDASDEEFAEELRSNISKK